MKNTVDTMVAARNNRLSRLGLLNEPAGYVDGQNLYEFVQSNPTDLLDPSGLDSQSNQSQITVSTSMQGNVRIVHSDVNINSDTLKIDGTADLRMRYSGSPDSFLDQLKSSNYTNESFNTNLNANFNNFQAGGVTLQGNLNLKANLDANYEGQFNINGNVLVKPNGWIPNARAKNFAGKVFAKVVDKKDGKNQCHAVCILSGSGSPDFFLLQLLVPHVDVSGYQESNESTQQLGAIGIVKLVKSTIENLHATAYLFGFIPIKLK